MKTCFLLIASLFLCTSAIGQFSNKSDQIFGIRVGGSLTKYKFTQFPLRPPVLNGTGLFNSYSTVTPDFQPNISLSVFCKKAISVNNWLDFELGFRSRGYKSYYAFVDDNLIVQPFQNRFLSTFATISLQLKLTQLWYIRPGIRMDFLLAKHTNPNYDFWTTKYSSFEPSPVLISGIMLPKINIELEYNPGVFNLVKFPSSYMASSSRLISKSIGLNFSYKFNNGL